LQQQPQVGMSIDTRVGEASQVTKGCCDCKNLCQVVPFIPVVVASNHVPGSNRIGQAYRGFAPEHGMNALRQTTEDPLLTNKKTKMAFCLGLIKDQMNTKRRLFMSSSN